MTKDVFLVLDIGTSNIKCACVNSDHDILVEHKRKFPMVQTANTFEIDFKIFLKTTKDLVAQCLEDQIVQQTTIEALLITSQAQTFVPVDLNFNPLSKGIVWLDQRAEQQADYLNENLAKYNKVSGFSKPLPGLYASKLLWLKQNEQGIFKNARYFPLIHEFLIYKFTGKFYSDNTSFGMSGMYDFDQKEINKKLMKILDLTVNNFPQIENAAKRGELISNETMLGWQLDYRFRVFSCGNDQSASASGAGLTHSGDININFGSAMVLYTITENLTTELNANQISGKYPVGNNYFLLNYESDFGIQIRRLKKSLFNNGTYDQLFQTFVRYPDSVELNPNFENIDLLSGSLSDAHRFCAGQIKYYLNRLKAHITQIGKQVVIRNIFLSGGMTQSPVWLHILQEELNLPVTVNNQSDAGLLGAINIYLLNKN